MQLGQFHNWNVEHHFFDLFRCVMNQLCNLMDSSPNESSFICAENATKHAISGLVCTKHESFAREDLKSANLASVSSNFIFER